MRRFNVRDIFGIGLIVFGGLLLLENLHIIKGATGYFWGAIWVAVSLIFFNAFARDRKSGWWNIIPAMVLLGLGLTSIMPKSLSFLEGSAFLGCLGLAFFIVYFTDNSRWWGIIPGGVMLTLAAISALDGMAHVDSGSVLFLGLGVTFLLVATLPTTGKPNEWAYIPSVILLAFGGFLMLGKNGKFFDETLLPQYLPYLLIGLGVVILARWLLGKRE
jgi:hypothetical protein